MATDLLPVEELDEEELDEETEPGEEAPGGMPLAPNPPGMFVGFLPSDIELEDLSVPGGLAEDDLHLTLRYYGSASDEAFIESVHEAARDIAGNLKPFVVSVQGRRQLGEKDPPADVLILADHKAFRLARERLPSSDNDYPAFVPHITVGYGIGDEGLAKSSTDNEVVFDHIVVGNGPEDWTVYMLGDIPLDALNDVNPDDHVESDTDLGNEDDIEDVPLAVNPVTAALALAGITAGIDDVIEGKIDAPGSRAKSKTVGKLDPRPGGSKQKCFHGSPATCKSVKWIAVYTALREKRGMTKSKAAAIANAMHNRWKTGRVGPRNHHPIIRKTI